MSQTSDAIRAKVMNLILDLLPAEVRESGAEQRRRGTIVVVFSLALATWGPINGALFASIGLKIGALCCLFGVFSVLGTVAVFRASRSTTVAGNWLAAQMFWIVLGCAIEVGGISSSALTWNCAVPVFAAMVAGRRAGLAWLGLVVVELIGLGVADRHGWLPPSRLMADDAVVYDVVIVGGACALMTMLAWLYETQKEVTLAAVDAARDRAEAAHQASREILDHVSDGFVVVDTSGQLNEGRSKAADRYLGDPPPGASLTSWVAAVDEGFGLELELGLEQVKDDFLPIELTLDQMPQILRRGEQTFRFGYYPLFRDDELERLLVHFSDVSSEEQAARAERFRDDLVGLVTRLAQDGAGARDFVADSSELLAEARGCDHGGAIRALHTLKGNCGVFGLQGMVALVHEAETGLLDGRDRGELLAPVEQAWTELNDVVGPLTADCGRETVTVARRDLEAAMRHPDAQKALRRQLESWLTVPLAPILQRAAQGASALAERLGKAPIEVHVTGGETRLDPEGWGPFWSSLNHVIRNCVDHGLEEPSHRAALGKPAGQLTLGVHVVDDELVVEVGDDGKGVAWNEVRGAARRRGLPADTREDLEAALFADGLSTRESVSTTSGRGVGMAAVRHEVRRRGGAIRVMTEPGRGTRFTFTIPLREEPSQWPRSA